MTLPSARRSRLPCGLQDKQLADVPLVPDICHAEEVGGWAGGWRIFSLFVFSVVVFFPFPAALFMDIDRTRLASTRPSATDLQLSAAAATSSPHQTRAQGGEGGEGGGSLSVCLLKHHRRARFTPDGQYYFFSADF